MQYPDWVKEAKRSKELLSWIKDPDHSIQQFGSQLLFKSKQKALHKRACSSPAYF